MTHIIPANRHRKSIRLKGYDYSQPGAYFVTICTQDRECLFGEIEEGQVRLNRYGSIVEQEWLRTPSVRPQVELDTYVIMPNHVHGIIIIHQSKRIGLPIVGATRRVAPTQRPTGPSSGSLGAIMAQFKSLVTKRSNELRNTPGTSVWQRNYHEHVIRNEDDFSRVREYIINNPTLWEGDGNNPEQIALKIGSGE